MLQLPPGSAREFAHRSVGVSTAKTSVIDGLGDAIRVNLARGMGTGARKQSWANCSARRLLLRHSPVWDFTHSQSGNQLRYASRRGMRLCFALLGVLVAGVAYSEQRMEPEFAPALTNVHHPAQHTARLSSRHSSSDATLSIALGDAGEIRRKVGPGRSGPTEIGFGRMLPKAYRGDLVPLLTWSRQDDGSYIAALEISSSGAKGMRAGIRALASEGVELHFFDPNDRRAVFPVYVPKKKNGSWDEVEVFWSPTVSSDRLGIEIHAPSWDAAAGIRLEIERVSHVFLDSHSPQLPRASPESSRRNSCDSVPAACGRSSTCTVAATAKLSFVAPSGHSYVCSGTVINDDRDISDKQNRALLHTAYHCIGSQGTAQSLEAEFHYGYEMCNGDRLDSRHGRYFGGADLLEALPRHDQSLIRLRRPLTIGGVCFSGWDPNRQGTNTAVFGVHHPGGRTKEWVAGRIRAYEPASFKELGVIDAVRVEYLEGQTQPGSSGSGLFLDNGEDTHFLLGSLAGGPEEDCSIGYYGSLSEFYPRIQHYLRDETPPPPADDHGNSRSAATEIAVNTTTNGDLESPNDVDYFTFTINGDGEVTIESTGSTDTIGILYDSEGRELQRDDDGGAGYNFNLSMDLAPGTYFVSVRGYEGEVGAFGLSVQFEAALVYSRAIPVMLAADEVGRQGFLRIQNYSNEAEITLDITGIDDRGDRFGPIRYPLEPLQSIHFNSADIEEGNPDKGLDAGLGDGYGWWRLQLKSSTPIFATSYVRTNDGFLTSIHDTALDLELDGTVFLVPIFNPASNVNQQSYLRISNLGNDFNNISVFGLDDAGDYGLEPVRFSLEGPISVYLDAEYLENGIPDIDSGSFGNGKGKWQLVVEAENPVRVLSLMVTPQGHITNLSTVNFAEPSTDDIETQELPRLKALHNLLRAGAPTRNERYPRLPPGWTVSP